MQLTRESNICRYWMERNQFAELLGSMICWCAYQWATCLYVNMRKDRISQGENMSCEFSDFIMKPNGFALKHTALMKSPALCKHARKGSLSSELYVLFRCQMRRYNRSQWWRDCKSIPRSIRLAPIIPNCAWRWIHLFQLKKKTSTHSLKGWCPGPRYQKFHQTAHWERWGTLGRC